MIKLIRENIGEKISDRQSFITEKVKFMNHKRKTYENNSYNLILREHIAQ